MRCVLAIPRGLWRAGRVSSMLARPSASVAQLARAMSSTSYRTHAISSMGQNVLGEDITLCGWAQNIRQFGELTFILLRDASGEVQITFDTDDGSTCVWPA